MVTKGVASVRSPVRNLQHYNPSISHESFVQAVVDSFKEEYGITTPVSKLLLHQYVTLTGFNGQVRDVEETEENKSIEYIRNGMTELTVCDILDGRDAQVLMKRPAMGLGFRSNSRIHQYCKRELRRREHRACYIHLCRSGFADEP